MDTGLALANNIALLNANAANSVIATNGTDEANDPLQKKNILFETIKGASVGAVASIAMGVATVGLDKILKTSTELTSMSRLKQAFIVQATMAVPLGGLVGGALAAVHNKQIENTRRFTEKREQEKASAPTARSL